MRKRGGVIGGEREREREVLADDLYGRVRCNACT